MDTQENVKRGIPAAIIVAGVIIAAAIIAASPEPRRYVWADRGIILDTETGEWCSIGDDESPCPKID